MRSELPLRRGHPELPGEHLGLYSQDRWWWIARGYTPAGVECWNAVRGLDYLVSRPEVDPNRIAATGLSGGTSFMEDYTYHLNPGGMKVLGAHMLEICPTIADGKPSLQVHPLDIGGKADPARLVFKTPAGPGLNTSLIDMGNRFRLLVNEVEVVPPEKPLPRLPGGAGLGDRRSGSRRRRHAPEEHLLLPEASDRLRPQPPRVVT